jgi:hypothetical protein
VGSRSSSLLGGYSTMTKKNVWLLLSTGQTELCANESRAPASRK